MTAPTVSVVMAAYNGAALIGETLASLSAQTMPDWEAIVVDDRSTDATREVVAAWPDRRVRLVPLAENGGPVRARNRALAEARGRYVAALDQDDLCVPERFARQVAYLDAHADVALVGTAVDVLRGGRVTPSAYPAHSSPALIGWLSWIGNPLVWSSVMVRADAAQALDPFTRPEMLYAEDFDLYHRIRPHGAIARLDTVLLHYRQHDGGASKRFTDTMEASATRVLAEAHAGLIGDEAATVAELLVAHHMAGRPVPDRASLRRLGTAMARLQAAYLDRHRPDDADRHLIKWETARRWSGIGRASLRAGTLSLADLVAVRPPHLGLGYAGPAALFWSRAIGATRQTLAAKIIRPGPSRANT
jgi:GT2 family glycosyltransferase